jgi:hypothetical protein
MVKVVDADGVADGAHPPIATARTAAIAVAPRYTLFFMFVVS